MPLAPFDIGTLSPRDGKHLWICIEPEYRAAHLDTVGHRDGQGASAAGHVEHALARPDVRGVAQYRAP